MISDSQKKLYAEGRANGLSIEKAARGASISKSSAWRFEKAPANGEEWRVARVQRELHDPYDVRELSDNAKRGLEDFGFFQRHYLGRVAIPYQQEVAEKIVTLLETPRKEFIVLNGPPGTGKSTLITHDIPLWLTCRNRNIRGLMGSVTGKLAVAYTRALRRSLESVIPIRADDDEKMMGIALDAETTVAHDYGRFKPLDQDIWTADAFIVAQLGNIFSANKEPTWTAVGRDQEFIGGRYDFCVWDDLVSLKRLRTIEMIEADRHWWDSYAERRLEPAGILVLNGQRLAAEDLYAYCRDMPAPVENKKLLEQATIINFDQSESGPRKYHHIKYKAHYPELCTGEHEDADGINIVAPYPEGCLLYPDRLPYRELYSLMVNRPDMYETVFQQEDVAAESVLVNPAWISGAGDHPGCWDKDRDRLEIPHGLTGTLISVVSCDPSPTRYWAIEWWLYHPESDQRFLVDLERRGMDAPDFLDWNQNEARFTGLMEEWQQTSIKLGVPISHWIVEVNAAQRFLLQYDHVRRWASKNSVEIVPHSTHSNKTDPAFGVQTIAPHYRYGRVRLPGKNGSMGRMVSMRLVDEVTRYPQTSTDDCVMAHWFFEFQLQYIAVPNKSGQVTEKRPHWLRQYQPMVRGRVSA